MSIKRTGKNPLTGIAKRIDKEVMIALEKAGPILEKEARRRVPVDTGRLQRSISWLTSSISNGLRLTFGSGVRGSDAPYAKYIEYGTKYFQGIPFLRSTLSDRKRRIERLIVAAIRRSFK